MYEKIVKFYQQYYGNQKAAQITAKLYYKHNLLLLDVVKIRIKTKIIHVSICILF